MKASHLNLILVVFFSFGLQAAEVSHINLSQVREYLPEEIMEPGEVLHGRVSLNMAGDRHELVVRWIDAFDRVAGEDRVLVQAPVPGVDFSIPLHDPLSFQNRIEVLLDGKRQALSKDFQIRPEKRAWDDYAAVLWSSHEHETFELLREAGVTGQIIYRDFPNRKTGVVAAMDSYIDNMNWRVFAPYHKWRPKWHAIRDMLEKDPYNQFIKVRSPSFEDPATNTAMKTTTQSIVAQHRAHRPLFYNLADEIGIGDQSAPIDLDHSYFSRNAFIQYLRNRYGSLDRLNKQWESGFDSFFDAAKSSLLLTDAMMDRHWELYLKNHYESVEALHALLGIRLDTVPAYVRLYALLKSTPPMTEQEVESVIARKGEGFDLDGVTSAMLVDFVRRFEAMVSGIEVTNLSGWNLSPWMDHRDFMDQSMANALGRARQYGLEADPDGLFGFTGGHSPGAHSGYNLYYLSQSVDVQIPYNIACDIEIIRGMKPGTILMSPSWSSGEKGMRELWYRLFHGDHGCLFWDNDERANSFLDKERYSLSERAESLAPTLKELTGGISKLVLNSKRLHDKIAIHYSHASLRASWMIQHLDLGREWRRESWHEFGDQAFNDLYRSVAKLIEDGGRQYEFVSTQQIMEGVLEDGEFKVLILPQSIALGDDEARAIRRFVARGGAIVADHSTGLMDLSGKFRDAGALDDVLGIQSDSGLNNGINRMTPMQTEKIQAGTESCYLNAFGSGRAIYLDRSIISYHRDRALPPAGNELLDTMESVLMACGIGKSCTLALADGSRAHGVELVRYANGNQELLAIFRNVPRRSSGIGGDIPMNTEIFETRKSIRLQLPEKRWIYNVRKQISLGYLDEIDLVLDPWEPILLATTQLPVESFDVETGSSTIRPGDSVIFNLQLSPDPGLGDDTTSVLNVQVEDANGRILHHYGRNIAFQGAETTYSFNSALNETAGPLQFSFTLLPAGVHQQGVLVVKSSPAE